MAAHAKDVAATIDARILTMRGHRVLLDSDLALLYGVTTGSLLQAVRRNSDRFPPDFAFVLEKHEVARLRSQSVISSSGSGHGGRRFRPQAFTEQGVAMPSSVLRSTAAIAVNIEIMRAFVRLRRASLVSEQVIGLISELSNRVDDHDAAIRDIIETIQALVDAPSEPKRPIGFVPID